VASGVTSGRKKNLNLKKIIPKYILYTILFCFILLICGRHSYSQEIKPPKISKINLLGNSYFSDAQLLNMLVSKPGVIYTIEQFNLDLKNIIRNYGQAGYLDAKITFVTDEYSFDSSLITISAGIDEGKQSTIGEIVFEGNKVFKAKYLRDIMYTKPGKVFDTGTLNGDIAQFLNVYEKRGYTFASINVKDIEVYNDNGSQKLRIIIRIDENEKIKINKVVIEGNTSTNEGVIQREVRLGKNNTITKDNIIDIKRRLENLGYFESVEQPKIYKYKSSTVLNIKVKEGNTNTFDGIVGYVPASSSDSSLGGYFTGIVNLSLRNLFGTGRRIDARYEKVVRSTQELELKYQEPWILGLPVNANIGFLQRIEDSTYIKRDLNLKADALLSRHFTLSALLNIERVIPSLIVNNNAFSIFDSRLLSTGVEIKFDSRDFVYNPYSGILYKTGYSVGQKKIYNAASFPNQNIPNNFTVQRGTIDLDFYHSFFRRQSILIGLHGVDVRSPKYEDADFFRIGGTYTVRGYREGQFLASEAAWSNIEARYSLSRKSFASLFYDIGYYVKPADDIRRIPSQKGLIYGYGLGIRIETGLGIFGISYALGKGDSILEGKIHFGIINDF